VNAVQFSNDGKTLASGSADGSVKLWDVATSKEKFTFTGNDYVDSVAFTSDGKTLAVGCGDGVIRLWDTISGQQKMAFRVGEGQVNGLAFSTDDQTLASASWKALQLWDMATGKQRTLMSSRIGDLRPVFMCIGFDPTGSILASGISEPETTIKLWEVSSGHPLVSFPPFHRVIHALIFDARGTLMATAGSKSIIVWDMPRVPIRHEQKAPR
jgi:WD40 repeat protein